MSDGSMGLLTRRQFFGTALAGVAVSAAPEMFFAEAKRPNLLFILADDLGYGDLSSFGRPDYSTPNLDLLVREGVRFTHAYSAASVCTPTRAAFMTGRYPARLPSGLQEPMSWVNDTDGLPPEHPTVASLLKAAGYDTALIGKWHLGYLPKFGPKRHGFDEFFGILSGGVGYFSHRDARGRLDLHEGMVPVERIGYLTDLLTERAVQYISRRRARPFYLSLHYTAPHWPWEAPQDQHVRAAGSDFAAGGSPKVFAEMMRSLDSGVGRVLAAMKKAGLDRNTLVIFTSDNGGERFSYNWPYSNEKATLWEGGIRVPAAIRWRGTIPARQTTEQVAVTMDWTATLLAAARVSADRAYPLDGLDLLPLCRDGHSPVERTVFWRQPHMRYNGNPPQDAVRSGRWKYLKTLERESLFDLSTDPGEKTDLSGGRPELVARFREQFTKWNMQLPPRLAAPAPAK